MGQPHGHTLDYFSTRPSSSECHLFPHSLHSSVTTNPSPPHPPHLVRGVFCVEISGIRGMPMRAKHSNARRFCCEWRFFRPTHDIHVHRWISTESGSVSGYRGSMAKRDVVLARTITITAEAEPQAPLHCIGRIGIEQGWQDLCKFTLFFYNNERTYIRLNFYKYFLKTN